MSFNTIFSNISSNHSFSFPPLFSRNNAAVAHQQQLMLLLPSLRQADNVVRRFWSNVHVDGNVTMNKLFVEMLESVSR
jgi:estrogen-related receptor ERR